MGNITNLSRDELEEIHIQLEKEYAEKVVHSPKDSQTREELLKEGYKRIKEITDIYSPGLSETGHTKLVQRIVNTIIPRGSRILDVGCASGDLLKELKSRYETYGIEICEDYVRVAEENIGENTVRHSSIESFQTNEKYDCIIMDNVIEHIVPDTVKDVLQKIYTLLNGNGKLLLITPHKYTGPHDISFKYLPLGSDPEGFHFKEYTVTEMEKTLSAAGFASVLTYAFWPGMHKWVGLLPSLWAVKKAKLFERVADKKLGKLILRRNKRLTTKIVSYMCPGIYIAVKNGI